MRVLKLVDGINLNNNNKKYNRTEVFIDSDNSHISKLLDPEKLFTQPPSVKAILTTVVY